MDWRKLDCRIEGVLQHYRQKDFSPAELIQFLKQKSERYNAHNIWIHLLSDEELAPYLEALSSRKVDSLPLYGVPFAIKDNIDLAGIPTTAACADFAYIPERHATVVRLLLDAGAIPLGKANMDQFATGLVGTRSPYGVCRNAFNPEFIAGGSSSGSALAVSLGLCSFALGTDTAGSGRVPAALNNLIGLKPTKGFISMSGVVPACRSLDCVSIFALTAEDTSTVFNLCTVYDEQDAYAVPAKQSGPIRQFSVSPGNTRIGIPSDDQLEFYSQDECRQLFERAIQQCKNLGAEIERIDFSPFLEAARLLYAGPWVAERYLATKKMIENNPEAMHPVIRSIIEAGRQFSAEQTFASQYRLRELKRKTDAILSQLDFILTPTIAAPYTIEQVLVDPVKKNSELGYYTNFMNLLDYSAIALPSGFTFEQVPWGVTLVAVAGGDQKLLAWAVSWQRFTQERVGATELSPYHFHVPLYENSGYVDIVVCGAHLRGQPLNSQLTTHRAIFIEQTQSGRGYRLYALPDGKRPALVRSPGDESAVEVEVWRMPLVEFGSFATRVSAPLGIGEVELADGRRCSGFICEHEGLGEATDITHFGGWRQYLAQRSSSV